MMLNLSDPLVVPSDPSLDHFKIALWRFINLTACY
jgi:hypothetical protein